MSDADPFAPLAPADQKAKSESPLWRAIMPVPDDAPPPPLKHPKHGAPTRVERYMSETSRLNFIIMRFDPPTGKVFASLTFCASSATGELSWRWQAPPAPRSLYGLDHLARRPAPVIVCEGEKSADAAGALASGYVVITSPNGSNSAAKADWSPLKGRVVFIWPDADEPGDKYARDVKKLALAAGAVRVVVLTPPAGVKSGWDADDAKAEGWGEAEVLALIAEA